MNKKVNYPSYGDVVCVDRSMFGVEYEHYAVYIGNGKVIEYSKPRKKKKASISPWTAGIFATVGDDRTCIIESDFEDFLEGASCYKICFFPDTYGRPTKEMINAFNKMGALCGFCGIDNFYRFFTDTKEKYHVYTPSETVQRAKSRLGEKDYFILTNNCEYFALWCKTGVHKSYQVQDFFNRIKSAFLTVHAYLLT